MPSRTIPGMTYALLVIDIQSGLVELDPKPDDIDNVIARINALAAMARADGVPVVLIQHERASGFLAHGSPGWALPAALHTAPNDHRVRKTTPDSFLRTGLDDWLRQRGVDHVVVCGYASEFCVDTTTRRAAALGLRVTLAADAHTTHDKLHASAARIRAHENATLPSLTSFGPEIRALPTAEIAFQPASPATSP